MGAGTIIVTGGAGYIGSHAVVDLVANGYDPVIVDDFRNSQRSVLQALAEVCGREVACHAIDCGDLSALDRVFRDRAPVTGVIHFAASKAVGESQLDPLGYYRNNLGGMLTLLETMLKHEVRDLVFSSSCVVYGQPDLLPVTEDTPLEPAASVYGRTKQFCESIVQDTVASGAPIRATLLRYFNPIGAHSSGLIGELPIGEPQNLAPVLMQSAAGLRGPLHVHGNDWSTPDGSCIRDFVHVMDLAEAHTATLDALLASSDASSVEALNLGSGQGTSVLEMIDIFERVTGNKLQYSIGPRRSGDIERIYANAERARERLGWSVQRSVDDALADAWRWQLRLGEAPQRDPAP